MGKGGEGEVLKKKNSYSASVDHYYQSSLKLYNQW